MNTTLTVDDPLTGQEVTIAITLLAGEQPRDERHTLVSLGIAGQVPIIKTGVFGNVLILINEAWIAFGVQAQLEAARVQDVITEEQVVATAATGDDELVPTPQPQPTAPKPQAKNLSLF
jgi:hypothetical protein